MVKDVCRCGSFPVKETWTCEERDSSIEGFFVTKQGSCCLGLFCRCRSRDAHTISKWSCRASVARFPSLRSESEGWKLCGVKKYVDFWARYLWSHFRILFSGEVKVWRILPARARRQKQQNRGYCEKTMNGNFREFLKENSWRAVTVAE